MKLRFWLMIILVLVLSPLSAFASSEVLTTTQRENLYSNAIRELEDYLYNKQDDPVRLQGIMDSFARARMGQSEALQSYAKVLLLIAEDSYGYDFRVEMTTLQKNQRFSSFLAEEMKNSPICSVYELSVYAEGRQAQIEGDMQAAMQAYENCLSFFDANDRYKQLLRETSESVYQMGKALGEQGDLAGAYYQFKEAGAYSDSQKQMQAIVDMLGYTPKDAQDNLLPVANLRCQVVNGVNARLTWGASEHATEYEVSYRKVGIRAWNTMDTTQDTSVTITNLAEGASYEFRVVACIGKTVRSEERALSGFLVPKPTPTPVPVTPTPRPATPPPPTPTPAAIPVLTPITHTSQSAIQNLLNDSEAERQSGGGFLGISVREALEPYIGQTVTVSFDLKASERRQLLIYAYQKSGISIADSFYVVPSTEYQRYSFTTTVRDYRSTGAYNAGVLGFYDQSGTNKAMFSVRRVKIELGTRTSAWVLSDSDREKQANFTYVIENGRTEITGYYGTAQDLAIPNMLGGYPVTAIGERSFDGADRLTSVSIPDGVTDIGGYAFCLCENLTSITIPGSVTAIGEYAFYKCTSLSSVTLPNGLKSIGERAFYDCQQLTSITIPGSVTAIGEYAFYRCKQLTSITIPGSVTVISMNAFNGCTSLRKVTLPNGLKSIGERAFYDCQQLTSITIPGSVTDIGQYAFCLCGKLTSITIPGSVTDIGMSAFNGCTSLSKVTLSNGVKRIGEWAFYNCQQLTSITIPSSVTAIGKYAFCLCGKLTSITIPGSVTSIGEEAFQGCNNLTVTVIRGSQAEEYCKNHNIRYRNP